MVIHSLEGLNAKGPILLPPKSKAFLGENMWLQTQTGEGNTNISILLAS